MNKKFRFSGKVEVDNIIKAWDINTTCGNVRNNKNVDFSRCEFCSVNFTRRWIEIRVYACVGDVGFCEELKFKEI